MENFDLRQMAQTAPKGFLNSFLAPVIFDEIQRVPELLSYIQSIVDKDKTPWQYILTGSHQPLWGARVSQSFAGRTGILRLLPLSIAELSRVGIDLERDPHLYQGFMPRLYDTNLDAKNLYRDYFATYAEKDLRLMLNVKDLNAFETFIKMLADRVEQLINLSALSNDVGVSSQTLSQWLSVLEASFIIFRLPCYFENFGKRLVKSQKLYFLRDSQGLEADLVFRATHDRLIPIEIKGTLTWHKELWKNLLKLRKLSPKFTDCYVIYAGELMLEVDGIKFVNFKNTASALA